MSQYIVWILVAAAFIVVWYLRRPDISSSEAHRLVSEGALLVDVRSPAEFAVGHVAGARNIPVGEIGSLQRSDRAIVLYCASGTRSALAARKLRGAGHSKVFNLGAMGNW